MGETTLTISLGFILLGIIIIVLIANRRVLPTEEWINRAIILGFSSIIMGGMIGLTAL